MEQAPYFPAGNPVAANIEQKLLVPGHRILVSPGEGCVLANRWYAQCYTPYYTPFYILYAMLYAVLYAVLCYTPACSR